MAVTAAVAAVVGTGYAIYSGERAADAQQEAMRQQQTAQQQAYAQAEKAQQTSQQNINRANQRQPDTAAILSQVQQSAAGGASGTMLTGPQGIDPSQLALGRNTLLGG